MIDDAFEWKSDFTHGAQLTWKKFRRAVLSESKLGQVKTTVVSEFLWWN